MDLITSLRQYRIGEFALFDFAVSYIAIWFLAPLLSRGCRRLGFKVPRANWLFLTLPLAVLFHLAFGTFTPLTKSVIDPTGGYVTKGVVLLSLLLGLRGIQRTHRSKRAA